MDFDLFELEDDEDILSSVYLEPTQKQTNSEIQIIPEFQCSGEDSFMKSQFSCDGFIRNNFINNEQQQMQTILQEVTLSAYNFQQSQLNGYSVLKFVFGEACMNIQYLMASVQATIGVYDEQSSYYQRRHQVTLLLHLILHTTDLEQWSLGAHRQQLAHLRHLINSITTADTWKLIYFANSSKGNDCNVAAYHLLHGALEWKLLDLCILQRYDIVSTESSHSLNIERYTEFVYQLERIFEDLIICSLFSFMKKRTAELLYSSSFPCTCFKELWLFLQLAMPKWFVNTAEPLSFWSVFNKVMLSLKTKMESFSLSVLSYTEFVNWLLHALTRLYGYRSNGLYEGANYMRATADDAENYDFCENCAQQFLSANPNEEQLRIYICLLMPTLLQWWRPKINIPILLWEHFHKRLNSSFYIAGAAPSNLAVTCATGRAYLNKYRALVEKLDPADANLSSYTLFTILLGKTLGRLLKAHLSNHAQKLLGRIYTKFSLQKFLALSETGIHNLIELFLVLSLSGDFNDLAPKLRDKLLSISFEKITTIKQLAVAKGHLALLIVFAEQHCHIGEYVTKLLQQLQSIRNDLAVSKIFADGLLDIFTNADDFCRGEYLLIDAWLPNFLNNCTQVEQERTLEALHLIFVKIQQLKNASYTAEANVELVKALNSYILPFIKQQYVTNFSSWLPQLAADFCIHTNNNNEAYNFHKLFGYFVELQTANRLSLPTFLLKVLESEKHVLVDAAVIMQVWLKSLVQLTTFSEPVKNLTKIVVQLDVYNEMTNMHAAELINAKEPLCVFVAAVGKHYDTCSNYQQRCRIADNFNAYIRNFEKWLHPDMKMEKAELLFRFYSFLAIVIYNCPQIVYAKAKITCFFHIAMTRFILPTSVQMGKPPEGKQAQLIHKIWPVLVQGIGRLNFKTDAYISKTLDDLIQKWTPHFKISPNAKVVARPFITCLQADNYELSLFIFDKLTNMFLATQRRQADPNACLVVTIFQEVVESVSSSSVDALVNEQRLETFMKGSCLLTLEHIMMVDELVPSRNLLLDLFKRLTSSSVYQNSIRLQQLLAEHLRIITKKHLAYYTFFYFELLMKLSQISPALVEQIMDFLREEVHIVEQKRGAGADNRIRDCLQKLQQSIAKAKLKDKERL